MVLQRYRRGVFITLLVLMVPWPAQAVEPLTLFLLNMLRERAVSMTLESVVRHQEAEAQKVLPQTGDWAGVYGVTHAQVREMIDTGFVHLSATQRTEIYHSFGRMLDDPKNALARPLIIQELAMKASAVRVAHERLAGLSQGEKRAIAMDARQEYERLPADERLQMVRLLETRIVPIPRDLSDMMLAEFNAVPVVPAVVPATAPLTAAVPASSNAP